VKVEQWQLDDKLYQVSTELCGCLDTLCEATIIAQKLGQVTKAAQIESIRTTEFQQLFVKLKEARDEGRMP